MKVALVYDRVNKWGGAERMLLHLHEMFPEAPLFTSIYSQKHAPWANVFPHVHTSFLQGLPLRARKHEFLPIFMPLAFESMNFDAYDLVISVTSEAAKGVITRGKTKHLCYCLTPTRYLWSGYEEYFSGNDKKRSISIDSRLRGNDNGKWERMLNKFQHDMGVVRNSGFRRLSRPMVNHLRKWDKIAAKRPDVMIGISKEVQQRIKKYYGRESELVYPGVDVSRIMNYELGIKEEKGRRQILKHHACRQAGVQNDVGWRQNNTYFLVVSRLVPYKKVDLAIEMANTMKIPLVIVGTGSEEKKLKRKAGNTVRFVGNVDDRELSAYYKNARALIFPQDEDFGLVPVEAHAHGIPVIAFKKGGALDTITDGKTGLFFTEQRLESLQEAVGRFSRMRFHAKDLKNNARKFSKEKFRKEFLKVVDRIAFW
jgi:glycosyltransferase involved in cell wall biosynthesis